MVRCRAVSDELEPNDDSVSVHKNGFAAGQRHVLATGDSTNKSFWNWFDHTDLFWKNYFGLPILVIKPTGIGLKVDVIPYRDSMNVFERTAETTTVGSNREVANLAGKLSVRIVPNTDFVEHRLPLDTLTNQAYPIVTQSRDVNLGKNIASSEA